MELELCPFCGGVVVYTVTTVGAYRCTQCESVFIISSQSGTAKHDLYNTRYHKPKPDDVPPLDAQKSNGFPSPYPTPFVYSQRQPARGERVLLFDYDDNEWLIVQLGWFNEKVVWAVDYFTQWVFEPKPTDRWLPFPPAP